jgi:pimeloyl-ACP methyl ester carboxylesterase
MILGEFAKMETGTPQYIAEIVRNMTPVLPLPAHSDPGKPMRFEVEIDAAEGKKRKIPYIVQLPPEYNPHRRYPCIMTLPTPGRQPDSQIKWWAGSYIPKMKINSGPAARHGYIVISPLWWSAGQSSYQYSVPEHDAVLASYRDAIRRLAIDTDRVFLSGHFKGGDAAWDIGLSHPDLWAGVIPISAAADKYVLHYFETAAHNAIPFYVVMGGKDFGIKSASSVHEITMNRWLSRTSQDFDVTLVEYKGRGGENYYEEIHNIFNWMKLKRRSWIPSKFNGRSLRPTDNFFWNLEVGFIPERSQVLPIDWGMRKPATFKMGVEIKEPNKFMVSPSASGEQVTFWLGPEFIDFSKAIEIGGRGTKFRKAVQPSRKVILEDVRTRGDRQHPFWGKVFCNKSRWVIEE